MRHRVRVLFTALVVALSALSPAVASGPAAAQTPGASDGLRIGTWNVNLAPWFAGRQQVVDTVAGSDYDVLALQGVWSADAQSALLADPRIRVKYPYFHVQAPQQEAGSIPYTPSKVADVSGSSPADRSGGARPQVTSNALDDFIRCVIDDGVDTRTVADPVLPLDGFCQFLGLNIALESQPGYQTLISTLETVPAGDPGAFTARDLGFAGEGVRYAFGGGFGQMVLSAHPLEDVTTQVQDTFLYRRSTVAATIDGVRVGFADWPTNVMYDIDPSLGPLQTGALQTDYADAAVHADPPLDLLVGSFSTGPDYQRDGFDQLTAAGFTPVTTDDTFCPAGQRSSSRCTDFGYAPRAVDNVFASPTGRCTAADTFAAGGLSEHVGVSARCARESAPTASDDSYGIDQSASLTVAAPGVIGNDTAVLGTPLHATLVTGPTHAAAFSLAADGGFSYTPVPGFSGTDAFTYTDDDGTLTSTPATVHLTVRQLPAAVEATSGGAQTAATRRTFAAPLVATVTDVGGNPAPGVAVTFVLPVAGSDPGRAVFADGSTTTTVSTGADGRATSPRMTATAPGPLAATAAVSGVPAPAVFPLAVTEPNNGPADLAVSLTLPSKATPGSAVTATVTVSNAGPSAARHVLTTLTLSRGWTVVGSARPDARTVVLGRVALLTAGSTQSYTLSLIAPRFRDPASALAVTLSGNTDPSRRNNVSTAVTRLR